MCYYTFIIKKKWNEKGKKEKKRNSSETWFLRNQVLESLDKIVCVCVCVCVCDWMLSTSVW